MLPALCTLLVSAIAPAPVESTVAWSASPFAEFLAPATSAESHDESGDHGLLRYTYLELGITQLDVDDLDDEADTYYARGSVGLLDFLYLFGQYENQDFDIDDGDRDLITVGGGVHFGVLRNLDLVGEIGWLFTDSDFDDDSGIVASGGARWLALPWSNGGLELNGEIGYYGIDNFGSDDKPVYFELGARAHFLSNFSVGAAYQKIEDDDQIIGNLRFAF